MPQLTVVIKVGTSSLIREETNSLNLTNIAKICESVRHLKDLGHHVCVVTSGAVGMGCQVMGIDKRPTELSKKQALAAIGQGYLIRSYSDFFAALSVKCAQVLLTAESLAEEDQYRNAQATFDELFRYGAVPIVNENDTIAVQELRFGDNDTLSAQVAAMVEADWLILLTDVDFLYTANPHSNPNAKPIKEVRDVAELEVDTSTSGTQWGTGGMATKLTAARIACAAGCSMAICHSDRPDAIKRIIGVHIKGKITVDRGCVKAVLDKKNVYAAGITHVDGKFGAMDAVSICGPDGIEIARGLVNYSSEEVSKLRGKASSEYVQVLGFGGPSPIMFRENIALVTKAATDAVAVEHI